MACSTWSTARTAPVAPTASLASSEAFSLLLVEIANDRHSMCLRVFDVGICSVGPEGSG